jgi:chromosome segregation ATPase
MNAELNEYESAVQAAKENVVIAQQRIESLNAVAEQLEDQRAVAAADLTRAHAALRKVQGPYRSEFQRRAELAAMQTQLNAAKGVTAK